MSLIPFFVADRSEFPANTPLRSRLRWPFAVACCVYYLLAYFSLAIAIPIFSKMFEGLGVDLPLPTRFLIASYRWLLPFLFVGSVILIVVKQFVLFGKIRLRVANLVLIFVGVLFVPLAVLDLYLPLFVLIHKLHSMK